MPDNQKLLPFAGLFGLMLLLGGVLFLVDGGWKTYRQSQHRGWPVVESRLEQCSVYGYWHYSGTKSSSRFGESTQVRCRLGYRAAGLERQNTVPVGVSIFTAPTMWQYPAPRVTQATQRSWVARHPSGSTLPIHVDPSDPGSVALIGPDDELQTDWPQQRLWFGGLLTAVGLVIFAVVREQLKKNPANALPNQPEVSAMGNPPR